MTKDNKNICLIIGIDRSINRQNTRDLRQDNQGEEEFLICSNTLMAFYMPKENVNFRLLLSGKTPKSIKSLPEVP